MLVDNNRIKRSRNIFNFIEWYKLNLNIRIDLVPVIEGIRFGALVELWKFDREPQYLLGQERYLKYCLKKLELYYKKHGVDYYISKSLTRLNRLWSREMKIGEFLGYPKCCIDAFEMGCQEHLKTGPEKGPAVQFYRKVKAAIGEGDFNEILFYSLHVPCVLDCKETAILAEKVESVLRSKDIEAAHHLRAINEKNLYEFHYRYPD